MLRLLSCPIYLKRQSPSVFLDPLTNPSFPRSACTQRVRGQNCFLGRNRHKSSEIGHSRRRERGKKEREVFGPEFPPPPSILSWHCPLPTLRNNLQFGEKLWHLVRDNWREVVSHNAILEKNMNRMREQQAPLTGGNPANLGTGGDEWCQRCSLGWVEMKLVIVTGAVLRDLRRMSERRVKCRMSQRYSDLINIFELRCRSWTYPKNNILLRIYCLKM